jgi:4-diphosphocytidyl-2-C-methyl-D-erythritol kinase
LRALAAELGSDVPFFLQGGTALGTSRGEILYPVDDIPRLGIVIVKPSFGVVTRDAYAWLDDDRGRGIEAGSRRPHEIDVGWPGGPLALGNDLQEAVGRRHPEVAVMVEACMNAGALGAIMSGSGSAVFGIFREATARGAVSRIRRPGWLVILTRTLSRREAARRLGLTEARGPRPAPGRHRRL